MGIKLWYSGVYNMEQRDHAVFLKSAGNMQNIVYDKYSDNTIIQTLR